MQFDSLAYLGLISLSFLAFHLGPKAWRIAILLTASFCFYASWSAPFLGLVLWSGFLDFYVAKRIHRSKSQSSRQRWLLASLISNLGLLAFFKYANFFRESYFDIAGRAGSAGTAWDIILPVGISFYTFQTMSYSIDVYRREQEPEENFLVFMLYVSFFPQLIAGPIERAGALLPQLKSRVDYHLERSDLLMALALISWGIFKKAALADNLARIVNAGYGRPEAYSSANLLLATYAFAFQIFFDFSAYTDIARGSALLFGIKLSRNFKLPYLARNPSDFWRRWHISLSEWIRDYLYMPLGGSRRGRIRILVNLLLTMALAGLWHGAAMHFIVWGLYHGLLLIAYRLLSRPLAAITSALPPFLGTALAIFLMFQLSCLGWIFFRAGSVTEALEIVSKIFSGFSVSADWNALRTPLLLLLLIFALMILEEKFRVFQRVLSRPLGFSVLIVVSWVATAILAPEVSSPFIYFQF